MFDQYDKDEDDLIHIQKTSSRQIWNMSKLIKGISGLQAYPIILLSFYGFLKLCCLNKYRVSILEAILVILIFNIYFGSMMVLPFIRILYPPLRICCGDFAESKKDVANKDFYLIPEGRLIHAIFPFYLSIFVILFIAIMERLGKTFCYTESSQNSANKHNAGNESEMVASERNLNMSP